MLLAGPGARDTVGRRCSRVSVIGTGGFAARPPPQIRPTAPSFASPAKAPKRQRIGAKLAGLTGRLDPRCLDPGFEFRRYEHEIREAGSSARSAVIENPLYLCWACRLEAPRGRNRRTGMMPFRDDTARSTILCAPR
jgi:hypothetical protein